MTREKFMKIFRYAFITHFIALILFVFFVNESIFAVILGISGVIFGSLSAYGIYLILKYNPNFEDQRKKKNDSSI